MKDCVFSTETKCSALTTKVCDLCPFRKTEEELEEGRKKAKERIKSLPEKQRKHIIKKYYKPWRKEQTE